LLLMVLFLGAAARCSAGGVAAKMKIPFRPKVVGQCYERLKKTDALFRDGVAKIRETLESEDLSAEERIKRVVALNGPVAKQSETDEQLMVDIDTYLCCVYDMLEAFYAEETSRILKGPQEKDAKRKGIEALGATVDLLPYGSPQYRTGIRPRYEKLISDALKRVSDK
jgi:hypothetical protein